MRTCKMCGQTKCLDQFANAGIIKGVEYKRHLCIPCYTISKKPRKNKVKKEYLDWKKTLQCNRCGINDYRVLQFHHHRDKESEISTMLSRGFSLDNIKLEAEKCEVLCANCHQIEHYNGA